MPTTSSTGKVKPGAALFGGSINLFKSETVNLDELYKSTYTDKFKSPDWDYYKPALHSKETRNGISGKESAPLHSVYEGAYSRVGEHEVRIIYAALKDALEQKWSTSLSTVDPAKIYQLFMLVDKQRTGQVHFQDFQIVFKGLRVNLNHDRLMALYAVEDSEGRGYLAYNDLVRKLAKVDGLARFQGVPLYDMDLKRFNVLSSLNRQLGDQATTTLLDAFKAADKDGSGLLAKSSLVSRCVLMGAKMTMEDLEILDPLLKSDAGSGKVYYAEFAKLVEAGPAQRH